MADIDPQEFGEFKQLLKDVKEDTSEIIVHQKKTNGRVNKLEQFRDQHEAEKKGRRDTFRTIGRVASWVLPSGGAIVMLLQYVFHVKVFW